LVEALLDACALFPRLLRDILLDAALARLYVPRWSAEILEELRRNLVGHRRLDEVKARLLVNAMQRVFPDAEVVGFAHLIPQMTNHQKDRHVLAAAVHCRASVIVTNNLVDFPESALAPYEVAAQAPDAFLLRLVDLAPDVMRQVIDEYAATRRNPPMTADQVLDRLAIHVPTFAGRIAADLMREVP
jgi:hypothetical protein